MIIIGTCPKCGHDLIDEVICTYPPIPRKVCHNCGWSWEGKQEEIIRVPFGGGCYSDTTSNAEHILTSYTDLTLNCGIEQAKVSAFAQSACENCPSNPKNGGDGICFCILGAMNIVY